jgi:phosphatidylglycerophosphate synthase
MTLAALVVRSSAPLQFAGLNLAERAERVLRRAGIEQVLTADDDHPFADAPDADLVVVLPERVIVESKTVRELIDRAIRCPKDALAVVDACGHRVDLALLSAGALRRVRYAPRVRSALRRLDIERAVTVTGVGPRFIACLHDPRQVDAIEIAYLRHTNGGDGEGVFTRNIRRFSIPLSRCLLRWSVGANQVTFAGFGFAILAGVAFATGTYWAGIVGALAYWISMVFDCSDGEVARGTLSDSKFGAWLETVTDYLSYFVVLGGILWGDVRNEGLDHHTAAAAVAALITIAIVLLVGYQRARVASVDPGAFDDALAAELGRGNATQRFAVWGRQFIKRSFVAHLIFFQAVIGFLPALMEMWAYGAAVALTVILVVQAHIIRSVRVQPIGAAQSL